MLLSAIPIKEPVMRPLTALALVTALVTMMAAGCASTRPEDDPVQIKLNDLDARLAKLERVISNQSLVDLAQRLDSVQEEERQLRGRLDELENSNEALRKQQRDLYSDLDKRVTALQGGAPGAGGTNTAGTPGPSGSSVAQTVYSQAFDALKAGSYSVAITGFKDFLANYPASPLAENAQYWLGEAYYVNHDYDAAVGAFRNVLQKWPQSRKAPDALLKLGYTQYELKKFGEARTTLTEVTQKFPDSDAAKLANDRLHRMSAK
jgi:tol-pal system protein YbgF